jgi:hypothetical protein
LSDSSDTEKSRTLDDLTDEFRHWATLPGQERDTYSAFAILANIYQYAINHYNDPTIAPLIDAIADAESRAVRG